MAMSGGKDDGSPMMEINTTPLIDVMLVLLIMFIITIPMATHSVDVDLPFDDGLEKPPPPIDLVKNKVSLSRQADILWNGEVITDGQLNSLLRESLTYATEPELQFEPEPEAPYDLASKVLNVIKQSKVTKFGFVGNEKYIYFSKD
ncbi:MAG: biopolymer transporter ExbD [Novosphingobium sp.]|nr:biopolymer transporter ExbD [Novosphingobium sp.]